MFNLLFFIVGIILLAIPFFAVFLFHNKKRGFLYVLFFLISFQTFLALLTQLFGIFYYQVILGCNLLITFVLLIWYFKNKSKFKFNLENGWFKKIDWVVFVVAIISVLTLLQVHYNYTGKFSMANDVLFQYHQAVNMKYVYPYFSDEWYAVSLVKESIASHSLPFKNPFDNSFFPDFEVFFHSFVAETMLFFGLDPLTQYTALSVFINTIIILLAYLFLRINNASKFASAISSLLILYITSASNLPGIWHLIPVTMGIIFSLMAFCFLSEDNFKMAFFSFLMLVFFYPPLFIFSGLALIIYFYANQ